ncbi:acetyl-CoA acetyltransferase [Bacterioplanes sanyensis]|uniref:Acetyl-CoA acetyltransferase n=1 Tax=Bacterioplanes sanyensis TaxID=1249553 RepID=A0A222FJQ4_9GAMM|nr:acetyl-CoA C-acetyltransferase [Bacterioplanes sanyensis]ASP38969.1 acetyl-CoA acetyltransferase [Bacterioplanes sanyensis]
MSEAFIFDAVRTPRGRGKADGSLHSVTPVRLMSGLLAQLQQRHDLDTSQLDDVVLGCVEPVMEHGADIARTAVLMAGYHQQVAGSVVSRFCASGLEAVNMAAAKVKAGEAWLTIGGGIECMSRIPMGSGGGAYYSDPSVANALSFVPQGISADLIASLHGFSREDVDSYAVESQRRAHHAWQQGYFSNSVLPVHDELGQLLLATDELMRPETTVADLAQLKPSFLANGQLGFDAVAQQVYPQLEKINHVHHAGNSSGIVDGAAAVLIGNKSAGEALGLTPRARICSAASIGSEPTIMLTGPTPSAQKALKHASMQASDIDLWELNEAFAAVVLLFMQEMGISHEQINVNGGAIAMGHPLGATGAMILGTVLDELERRDANTALVNLCVGGGMGTATIIERV